MRSMFPVPRSIASPYERPTLRLFSKFAEIAMMILGYGYRSTFNSRGAAMRSIGSGSQGYR